MNRIKGSGKEVGELPPVECTYSNCKKRFMTVNDMKRHKLSDPDHDYCKTCDVDCKDWDDLTQHKVENMQTWLEGRNESGKADNEECQTHIVCEFCGQDFKSWGGRDRHRETNHRAKQTIQCQHCRRISPSAATHIAHFAQGECSEVTRQEFIASVQQKTVQRELLENRDEFKTSPGPYPYSNSAYPSLNGTSGSHVSTSGSVAHGSEAQNSESRTTLLDEADEAQAGGRKPLQPQSEGVAFEHSRLWLSELTRNNDETWPRQISRADSGFTGSMASMSVKSPSISDPLADDSEEDDVEDAESKTIKNTTAVKQLPTLWGTQNTSKTLFKDAKPTPPPGKKANLRSDEVQPSTDMSTNLFRVRFWDSSSPDYDPDRFWNPITETYHCPFPNCETQCDTPQEMYGHIHCSFHLGKSERCPVCLHQFKTGTALIGHCETTLKCRIRESKHFGQLMDRLTGGFLEAKRLCVPILCKPGEALVKAGEPVNGVQSVRFTAKLPNNR